MQNLDEDVLDDLLAASIPEETVDLILAALEGPGSLDAVLAGERNAPRPDPRAERTSPQGTFLTELRVSGFRGVGPETRVVLPPGAGLTVIAGRNGSGKSSLAEAVECALTGTSSRWNRKIGHTEFGAAWRNLHHPESTQIEVRVDQAGVGPAAIRVNWPRDATDASTAKTTYQVQGKPREDAATALGWASALQSYRPLLSYDDLGQLLTARPSELHDSIARALALDDLHQAIELLRERVRPLTQPLAASAKDRRALKRHMETVDDDRARAAAKLLGKSTPDVDRLTALAAGRDGGDTQQLLAAILAVDLPEPDDIETAAAALEAAETGLEATETKRSRLDALRDGLLSDALDFHQESGDAPCPVCETGHLNATWRQRATNVLGQTNLIRQSAADAQQRQRDAERRARDLLHHTPAVLTQSTVPVAEQSEVLKRWERWCSPEGPLPDHLRQFYPPLREAVERWQGKAARQADESAARWEPLAREVAAWVEGHILAQGQAQQGESLDAACKAAVECEKRLRAQRLSPIVERSKAIWRQLRQESNVELEDIVLTGVANRRGLDITARVDDTDGDALAVMSQGELNSLALALFIPRVTSEQSPFRFLILDDPVQAMDPTKVEGLAAVLAEIALSRQVIVFSHDDRLAQAVRRLARTPTVLAVHRGQRSEVIVQQELGPAIRYLEDAKALAADRALDDDIKRRVLPGVLRQAMEEAAWQSYSQSQLHAGVALTDVENAWRHADRLRARLQLVHGDGLADWLSRADGRRRAVDACKHGGPLPATADLHDLVRDGSSTVRALLSGAR